MIEKGKKEERELGSEGKRQGKKRSKKALSKTHLNLNLSTKQKKTILSPTLHTGACM